ncbi:MAG: AAA family ATPase [Rhodospirillales bacterium]|nr:AAA family ATPase [Rhodospirillales bacterium]
MNDIARTVDAAARATADAARLPPAALFTPCDENALDFETTDDLEPLDEAIGQDRAAEAVRFAMGMRHAGYNLFAFGPAGTGKYSFVRGYAERIAAGWAVPPDWCYVHNFAEPHRPRSMQLPAGRARPFHDDSERLIDELRHAIPATFESDEYRNRKGIIQEQFKERQEEAFNALQARARERDVAIIRTPVGLALAPTRNGEVLGPKEFEELSADEKRQRATASEALQKELEAFLREVPGWERQQREEIRSLNRETTMYAVSLSIDEFKKKWADYPAVLQHLDAVRDDVIENADDFLPQEQQPGPQILAAAERAQAAAAGEFRRYRVNVLVAQDHRGDDDGQGAPVIYEDHPTQPSLVGRIEHLAQFGTLVTDFTLIKPGALHRANGGCLIVDARKLLLQPYAYETFKRALRSRCIRIESPAESLGWTATTTLEPEPIPLDVKVVLLGDPMLYYLLALNDPEFSELFRVAADFGVRMDRGNGNTARYARLIRGLVRSAGVRPFDRSAVARVVEQSARNAGDAAKLSTHMGTLDDLVRETDYWAGQAKADVATADHVDAAIAARIYRSDSLRERIQEEIRRQTIVIETTGARVGQINGLAVIQLNHFAFGRPSRISCRVRLGKGEVVDIEREVALGGPLHSKGVLILSSFLATRYAADRPLSLSASLVFEQSYGGVDGDSASSAELYALISALAEIPIRQSLAVTGSVDQTGRVQAIGGVNEKIEGFFDVCAARGLTGDQGVLIPAANVKHLMLRADVVEACAAGRFAVYAVETVDQGIEILTGVAAGQADDAGAFPIGSVNRAVALRLGRFAATARRLAREDRRGAGKKGDEKERRS